MTKKPKLSKTGKERKLDPRGIVRGAKTHVKTARYRKSSSTRWLQRQLNDPYVAAAKRDGYRSRAAYKIIELDENFTSSTGLKLLLTLVLLPVDGRRLLPKNVLEIYQLLALIYLMLLLWQEQLCLKWILQLQKRNRPF